MPQVRRHLDDLTHDATENRCGSLAFRLRDHLAQLGPRVALGHIEASTDPSCAKLHQSAMRWWIARPKPKVSEGIADLRRIYSLHLRALNPSPAAFGSD